MTSPCSGRLVGQAAAGAAGAAAGAAGTAAAGDKEGTGRLKSLPIDLIPEGPRPLPPAHGIDLDIPAHKHASFSVV